MENNYEMSDFPIIKKYDYNSNTISQLERDKDNRYISRYPTVYIIIDKLKGARGKFKAYVGETNNIVRRTEEHLKNEPERRKDWNDLNHSNNAHMFVIAHEEFNKSLTLDIENQLMQYLVSDDAIGELNNRRGNDQDLYYTQDHFESIFQSIWDKLAKANDKLFPKVDDIQNSAIFKASPFHKLTAEQLDGRDLIIDRIRQIKSKINKREQTDNLIIVEGSAGTGKTVLLSSLFAELNKNTAVQESYILVNHDQQNLVYKNIADKLGLKTKLGDDIANKPTPFLNKHPVAKVKAGQQPKADIVLVDEAHLLLTQGHMAYKGKNQLLDIMNVADVVIAVLDLNQVLKANSYMEDGYYKQIMQNAEKHGNLVKLKHQNRMQASPETMKWIEDFLQSGSINPIPQDDKYDLRIFDDVNEMYQGIVDHNDQVENLTKGLSRVVATYDWEYNMAKSRQVTNADGSMTDAYWNVTIGDFHLPWNYQLEPEKQYKKLPWAEQPQTINEVGSTFSIQGFDLNYCGLIIGPSVKFRNGKIVYDGKASKDKQVTVKRTLSNGKKLDASATLIKNELNVLIKRGVHGLFIYAVDDELRHELLKNQIL